MNATDWEKSILALVLWREARGQGEVGLQAVAHVIRNRVVDWKSTWTAVICGRAQFSSMTIANDSQLIAWPLPTDSHFQLCMKVAEEVYGGTTEDPTQGAHYYYNPTTANSKWFTDNIVVNRFVHPQTAIIGAHTFFK